MRLALEDVAVWKRIKPNEKAKAGDCFFCKISDMGFGFDCDLISREDAMADTALKQRFKDVEDDFVIALDEYNEKKDFVYGLSLDELLDLCCELSPKKFSGYRTARKRGTEIDEDILTYICSRQIGLWGMTFGDTHSLIYENGELRGKKPSKVA